MVPQCYVDGDVAEWDTDEEDTVGCDVAGLVVYLPEMTRRQFETWCDWLEYRAEARVAALLAAAASRGGRFGLIDAEAEEVAEEAVAARFGASYLEEFINDAGKVALEAVGASFRRIGAMGASVSPPSAVRAVSVFPAKSFRTEKALRGYLQEGRATWRPSVRLCVSASLDGAVAAVAAAAADLKGALAECGTVTEWKARGRPCSANANASVRNLRLVSG